MTRTIELLICLGCLSLWAGIVAIMFKLNHPEAVWLVCDILSACN